MKFKQTDLIAIIDDTSGTTFNGMFKVIKRGPWICDGKYEFQDIIFAFKDKTYILEHSRTGSPYTEFLYDVIEGYHDFECVEVKKVEIITHKWIPVDIDSNIQENS
tara:strand:- start:282 stop:599 length:318 start_codon:yes stop_codon:yes gene_type:complete